MDRFSENMKKQMGALLRVINIARTYRDDNIPCQIEEGLYLGTVWAAKNKNVLKDLNITHVLTVASSLSPEHSNDFVYKVIPVMDREETDLAQYFDECIDFIDEAKNQGGGVLVHCVVGRSRSVTIVVAYLMKKHGMNLSKALQHVKSRRPVACPNASFSKQLKDLEKSLQGKKEAVAQGQA